MDAYALKIHQKTCAKTAHFFNQSEFRKKSIIKCKFNAKKRRRKEKHKVLQAL